MGILVPEHFPLSQLKNDEERIVVEAFRDRLTDGWLVIPQVGLHGRRDREIDIVLAHESVGVAIVEVKGHAPRIERGQWMAHGRPMEPQPFSQARDNAYDLRDRLRDPLGNRHLHVEYAVAFPNASAVLGTLPPDVQREQLFTSDRIDDPQEWLDTLMRSRARMAIGSEGLRTIVRELRPDATFTWDPESRAAAARAKLEQVSGQAVRALERLDVNRRVMVTGAAGTGKTRLAMAWARRAVVRGEEVLLTCYNEPLADAMAQRMPDDHRLTVGPFLRVALALAGMPPLEVPAGAGNEFWNGTVIEHLGQHWGSVTKRFDTIVIDEAHDMTPAWVDWLQRLLDPAGRQRLLMVGDARQDVYHRGLAVPTPDEGWTHCELAYNCRNTGDIAQLLRRQFDGAALPVGGPETHGIRNHTIHTVDELIESVGAEYDRIIELEGHATHRVLFATFSTATRTLLRNELGFVEWDLGTPTTVICENVHRVKGLEFDYVVLAAGPDDHVSDQLLYVGASRAISGLTVIAPPAVGERLGLG